MVGIFLAIKQPIAIAVAVKKICAKADFDNMAQTIFVRIQMRVCGKRIQTVFQLNAIQQPIVIGIVICGKHIQ